MMHSSVRPLRRLAFALAVGGVAALPACTRDAVRPEALPQSAAVQQSRMTCEARVLEGTVTCAGPLASARGVRGNIIGGQGSYIRMTSSAVSYNSGTSIFQFNATVQNLSSLAMATTDGATRHDGGVQVFLTSAPVATTGSGTITVANATGTGTFMAPNQDYFQYGGKIGGVDQGELGADGILSSAETSSAKQWQFNVPNSVGTFSFTVYVATEMPAGSPVTMAPQISSISPATLIPGAAATITGYNFNATPGSNAVVIGGRPATVTGGNTTTLNVTVPCTSSGTVPVEVTQGGMKGVAYTQPLQVTQRTVPVGQMVVTTSAAESFCNELPSVNGTARYIVSVFSDNTSPSSNSPMAFSADNGDAPGPLASRVPSPSADMLTAPRTSLDDVMANARQELADARHADLMEKNRAAYQLGRTQFPRGRAKAGMRVNHDVAFDAVPATRQFRVSNISPPAGQTICSSFYVVNATRVYYNGKLAIYEDDATPAGLRSSDNASMAAYYQQIGDQFNADMEPIIRNNFGDVLRRDSETDNNGIEIALFTPRINNSFSGVAGFVVSCDQFPNNDTTTTPRAPGGPYTGLNSTGGTASFGASNFGENFYAYQPTINGTGFGTVGTPDYWYRTIRSTFIHESKHIAAQSARVANNAPAFEDSWLEEGMARHAEELWMRNAVDNQAWKSNIPFGSFANPINVYCDLRTTAAECIANPRRPSVNMLRHFNPMYTEMFGQNARLLSPFGATASDTQSYWYAISWSLVRYAADRYGASDAVFLGGLTQSTTNGVTNLTGQAGVSLDQLLGGWTLALAADDHPLLAAAPSADIQFPTWNMRSIYAGLNTDPNASGFTLAYPLVPTQLAFGSFNPSAITTLRGGGALWYEISGTQTKAQLLRVQTNTGGLPSANLRIAVTRIQ
ncbi:MAG TPA: IPT/TIG domain-containing protein [Longimicrobiaceae bacterium]|nr:IPT/TIG domain-containing protein [Longimicrobiaceae bacterium]